MAFKFPSAQALADMEGDATPFAVAPRHLHKASVAFKNIRPIELDEDARTPIYKTVEMFAGITQRKLWVTHDDSGYFQTDGHGIRANLDDPDAYRKVEHELAHILFKSDPYARASFVQIYGAQIVKFAETQGTKLNANEVALMLKFIINLLEDRRVNSLWGMLYPGSEKLLKELALESAKDYVAKCQTSFMLYFGALSTGIDMPAGHLDVYRPVFEYALQKVERKGYRAILMVAKWLVVTLVAEIIKNALDTASAPGKSSTLEPEKPKGSGAAPDVSGVPQKPPAQVPTKDPSGPVPPSEPSKPGSNPVLEKKTRAFEYLVKRSQVGEALTEEVNDVLTSKYAPRGAAGDAQILVKATLGTDISDLEKLNIHLDETDAEMEAIVEKARQAIRAPTSPDDRLRRDIPNKVNFVDLKSSDIVQVVKPLKLSDLETIHRLRTLFLRVLGGRRFVLDDAGVEVDVQAFIERRLSGEPRPCFRREERGRGFRTLVLLDRSSSMRGQKTAQAERACRIISTALKFPFVHTTVWGFQALGSGRVDISRFHTDMQAFTTPKSPVDGGTPLHLAIRLAVRQLMPSTDQRQLVIITDGEPHYLLTGERRIPTSQIMLLVRQEIQEARKQGINVTCLMIGNSVPPDKLKLMFGASTHWKVLTEAQLGDDMVRLVSSSFVRYLRSR